jgi:hypothetical protein
MLLRDVVSATVGDELPAHCSDERASHALHTAFVDDLSMRVSTASALTGVPVGHGEGRQVRRQRM